MRSFIPEVIEKVFSYVKENPGISSLHIHSFLFNNDFNINHENLIDYLIEEKMIIARFNEYGMRLYEDEETAFKVEQNENI